MLKRFERNLLGELKGDHLRGTELGLKRFEMYLIGELNGERGLRGT